MTRHRKPGSRRTGPRLTPAGSELADGTRLTWLTCSGFLIESRGLVLAIDPPVPLDRADLVLCTHADEDHFVPAVARALAGAATLFVGPQPVVDRLRALGLRRNRLRLARAGRSMRVGQVRISTTPADHPWQLRDPEKYGPPWGPEDCCGYLLHTADGTIWHPGDTRLMDQHLRLRGVDVLLLDVARDPDHLDTENAALLANALGAPHVIAHHHGSFDGGRIVFTADPLGVAARLDGAERRFHVPTPGQSFVLSSASAPPGPDKEADAPGAAGPVADRLHAPLACLADGGECGGRAGARVT